MTIRVQALLLTLVVEQCIIFTKKQSTNSPNPWPWSSYCCPPNHHQNQETLLSQRTRVSILLSNIFDKVLVRGACKAGALGDYRIQDTEKLRGSCIHLPNNGALQATEKRSYGLTDPFTAYGY